MRYLKNFESLNINSYYREIYESEWCEIEATKPNDFCNLSEEALNIVRRYFDDIGAPCYKNWKSYCEFLIRSDEFVQVMELKDEWFLFYYTPYGFYICDQLEGLNRLLSDISEGSIE